MTRQRSGAASIQLPADASSAGEARRFVAQLLRSWHCDDELVSSAALLTTELVTNSVLHAGTPIEVTVALTGPDVRVRVEVSDEDDTLPTPRPYATDAMTGRGLRLVEAVASRWGAEARAGSQPGKVVWFELSPN